MKTGYLLKNLRWGLDNPAIPVASYEDQPSDTGNAYGISGAGDLILRSALRNKANQIIQNCTISELEFYVNSKENLTGLYFEFWWREEGETTGTWPYTKLNETENLAGKIQEGHNRISVNPVSVLEGTLIVARIEASAAPCQPLFTTNSVSRAELRELRDNDAPVSVDFDWKSQTLNDQKTIAIKPYTKSPVDFKLTGNSKTSGAYADGSSNAIMASYAVYGAFSRVVDTEKRSLSYPYQLMSLAGVQAYQNTGVNSNTSSDISRRLLRDLNLERPKRIILESGVNDLSASIPKETVFSNLCAILDYLQFFPETQICVLGIMPSSNLNDTQAANRRAYNDLVEAEIANRDASRHYYLNLDDFTGQTRVSTGELDDMLETITADGTHFNETGVVEFTAELYSRLNAINFFDNI